MRYFCAVMFYVLFSAAWACASEADYPHLIDMKEVNEYAVYENEWQWLTENSSKLVVAYNYNNPPYSCYSNGQLRGLFVDYINLLEKRLGCQFFSVSYTSAEELEKLLKEKKAAVAFVS